jgi:predicted  nucleic acid-binding Zn-ribbon protein
MGAKLQALFALQEIELQIVDIRRQLERKERRVNAQRRKLKAVRESIEAERITVRKSQSEFDALDGDIKGRSVNIDRLREHLNTVRTNKEYATVLARMNNEKADVSRLEARALQLMQGVEARKGELVEHERAETVEAERLEEYEAQLTQTRASFAGRLERLQRQREEATSGIEPRTTTLFERLAERYEGEVLAEVERTNPRKDEFICAGCHMSLRVEVANMLKSRDEIVVCKSCGRILFMHDNT